MNKFKSILAAVAVSAISVVALTQGVSAITKNTNTAACNINPSVAVTITDTNKNFTYNADGTVTAKFKVDGTNASCKKSASLAVWSAPTGKQYPLTDQKFYSSATKSNVGKGEYTLTAKLPCGYWQVDLVEGNDPKGLNGTADYGGLGSNGAHMLDTHFDKTTCEEPEVCPYDHTMEKNDPNCKPETPVCIYDSSMPADSKDCVKPETPTKTVTKPVVVTQAAPVTSVPNTGADAGSMLAGTMGLSTSTGLAYNLFRKRRLLK